MSELEKILAMRVGAGYGGKIVTFTKPFVVDGQHEVISSGQKVLIADAMPDGSETKEDVSGYCDVYAETGRKILEGTNLDFEGMYVE